jgi:hypothetical protein
MTRESVRAPEPAAGITAAFRWLHRLAAVAVLFICFAELPAGDPVGFWATAGFALLPFLLLEAVCRIPRTRRSGVIFLTGAIVISASLVLYAPQLSRGSGEWARLNFLFIPALQFAGGLVLAGTLAVLRLFAPHW